MFTEKRAVVTLSLCSASKCIHKKAFAKASMQSGYYCAAHCSYFFYWLKLINRIAQPASASLWSVSITIICHALEAVLHLSVWSVCLKLTLQHKS